MKKFLSFTASLLSAAAIIGGAFLALSYFFYSKQKSLQELLNKKTAPSDEEEI